MFFEINNLKEKYYMKKIHFRIFLLLIILILFVPLTTYSSSIKEDYELQERCEKSCQEYIRIGNPYPDLDKSSYHYRSHYNKILNKCFLSLTVSSSISPKTKMVIDVQEHKTYGFYNGDSLCSVLDKKCNSEKEWDLLVKPLMEK